MGADRLEVWASQFIDGDFPEICALTGARSETWLKFRFSRRSAMWAFGSDLPFPFGDLIWFVIRDRVKGRLPLTNWSRRTVLLARWTPIALLCGPIALWTAGATFGVASDSGSWSTLFLLGIASVVWGLLGAYVVKPLISPRGFMRGSDHDEQDIVVLSNVHPNFVAAVQQQHAARAAQAGHTA